MNPIGPHITAFFSEYLAQQRRASVHTCDTYAYAFTLLFEFMSTRLATSPAEIQVEQLDASLIAEFLCFLQKERGNSSATRNARLAALKSFMNYLQYRIPSALEQIRRVLALPTQKTDSVVVLHLTNDETQAPLDAPDPTTRLGVRDRAMLHLALAGGLRVSELVGLRLEEASFSENYLDLLIRGKGRKQRVLRLWKAIATSLRAWLSVRGPAPSTEVFLNYRGTPITRSGFECILSKHVVTASKTVPSMSSKKVSPHVLRHTCALNILRATGDIRKVALWLGHARLHTAEVYLRADTTERLEVLSALSPPNLRPGKFRPPDRLIAALRGS